MPLLQTLAELPEATLHHGLAHLQGAEFLYETRLFPEHVDTFKHTLTHEGAYGSLLQERRRGLHARIVETLECLTPDCLAHHALRGEVWDKTLAYCLGRRGEAKACSKHPTASRWGVSSRRSGPWRICRSSATPTSRPSISASPCARCSARLAYAEGAYLVHLHDAEALATALDDARRLGQGLRFLSLECTARGAYAQAIWLLGQRTLALATASGDGVLQARAHHRPRTEPTRPRATIGGRSPASGRPWHPSMGSGADVLPPAVAGQAPTRRMPWRGGRVHRGQNSGGRRAADRRSWQWTIRRAVRLPRGGAVASPCARVTCPGALPLLEQAVSICQGADLFASFPWVATALGAAYTLGGRAADAVPLLMQARQHMWAIRRQFETLFRLSKGEAHLLAGRPDEGRWLR